MEKDAKRRRIEAGEATASLKVDYGNGIAVETLEDPLARYDYAAATALARQSAPQSSQGLLVTCPFRREKSATLELKAVFQSCKGLDGFRVSLVKVHEGGKVFVRFAKKSEERPDATLGFNAVALLSTILQNEVPPRTTEVKFIERLFPVEAICRCEQTAIENALVSILRSKEGRLKLESARKQAGGESGGSSLKFAVGSKTRRFKIPHKTPESKDTDDGGQQTVVDVVAVLAKTFAGECGTEESPAVVDLKGPHVVILCESFRVDNSGRLLGFCLIPADLADIRSKGIFVRPLVKNKKPS